MEQDTRDVIDRLDRKLDDHTRATNDKLDKLIEITRDMAVVHQKQIQQGEELLRVEKLILQSKDDFRTTTERIETRITTIDNEKRASIERLHKRVDDIGSSFEMKDDLAKQEVLMKVKEVEVDAKSEKIKLESFKDEFSDRVSFVRGVMWVLGVVMVVAQGLAVKYVSDMQNNIDANQKAIVQMGNRFNETDKQLDAILNSINGMKK
jgi:hypothetical protein